MRSQIDRLPRLCFDRIVSSNPASTFSVQGRASGGEEEEVWTAKATLSCFRVDA
jgi:hypothetical protein